MVKIVRGWQKSVITGRIGFLMGMFGMYLAINMTSPSAALGEEAMIVELTQTPCTIVEAENDPEEFVSNNSDDCVRINNETSEKRSLKVLRLKPGKTIFRVLNKNVPYDLGFWVRGKGLGRVTLPSVSGGGLTTGKTLDYVIDLKPGEYLYSCPLNPTPDYPLIVEE